MAERIFPIETVLSCVAFYKINNNIPVMVNHVHLANLLAFMADTQPLPYLTDHIEFIAGLSVCGLALVKQRPALGDIVYPYIEHTLQPEHFIPWMADVRSSLGAKMMVQSGEGLVPTEAERALLAEVNRTLKERLNL